MAASSSKLHALFCIPTASETPDIFFVKLYDPRSHEPRFPNVFQPLRFLPYDDPNEANEELERHKAYIQDKYHLLRPLFQRAYEAELRRAYEELLNYQQQQQPNGGLQPIQEEDETEHEKENDDAQSQDDDFFVVDQSGSSSSSSSSEGTSTPSNDTDSVTMVQLTEVPDEHFENPQVGPEIEDDVDDDYSDTDSEISVESEYDPSAETLAERLSALRDIIPPTTRSWVSSKVAATVGFGRATAWFAGKAVWVVTSTALLIGVPYAICVTEEQQVVAMEQEYKMREVGSEVLTAEGGGSTADRVGAAIGGPSDVKAAL